MTSLFSNTHVKSLMISAAAMIAVVIPQWLGAVDFGAYTPVVQAAAAVLVNAIQRWVSAQGQTAKVLDGISVKPVQMQAFVYTSDGPSKPKDADDAAKEATSRLWAKTTKPKSVIADAVAALKDELAAANKRADDAAKEAAENRSIIASLATPTPPPAPAATPPSPQVA